jgi:hypothetical protein
MRSTKRAKLRALIDGKTQIGEQDFQNLLSELSPISESYLRKLLRESGVPLAPMVNGVHQSNLEELESTLLALLAEYEKGDTLRKQAVRNLVIAAKDRARWAHKEENLLWLTTWLENPPLFPTWARLRRR